MRGAILASLVVLLAFAGLGLAQKKPQPVPAQPAVVLADLLPGEGWQELPLAPEEGLSARAWSDPAAGCHLVSLQVPIPATAQVDPLMKSFAKTLAKEDLVIADVEGVGDSRWLSLGGEGLVGLANLQLKRLLPTQGTSSARVQACYWNHREPERCRSICRRVLGRGSSQGTP